MRDFGEILAENRKKKGYSQSDLVDLLSQEGIQVTTKAISKMEKMQPRCCLTISGMSIYTKHTKIDKTSC